MRAQVFARLHYRSTNETPPPMQPLVPFIMDAQKRSQMISRMLSTLGTRSSTSLLTVPTSIGPSSVLCIRIPVNGSPIHMISLNIITQKDQPSERVPELKEWWHQSDPNAQLLVRTLPTPIIFRTGHGAIEICLGSNRVHFEKAKLTRILDGNFTCPVRSSTFARILHHVRLHRREFYNDKQLPGWSHLR